MVERPDRCAAHEVDVRVETLGGVGLWHLDVRTRAFWTNAAARALLGWPADEPPPTLDQYLACVHPEDAARVAAHADALVRSGEEYSIVHRAVLPGGRLAHLRATAAVQQDGTGRTRCVHGVCLDVTDLQHAAAEAEQARARARAVLDTLPEGYLLTTGTVVLEVNAALCAITGYGAAELEGMGEPCLSWDQGQKGQLLAAAGDPTTPGVRPVEVDALHKDGTRLRLSVTVTAVPDEQGSPLWAVLVRDVTVERADRRRLEEEAHSDGLTGLPNSRTFRSGLRAAVGRARVDPLSLAVIDLDHFKDVNDTHGHSVGDDVLVETARRLSAALPGVAVARIGGEEFAVVFPGLTAFQAHQAVGRALSALRSTPFPVVGTVTGSAGVAQLLDGMDDDALFRLADALLYEAKDRGRNQVR